MDPVNFVLPPRSGFRERTYESPPPASHFSVYESNENLFDPATPRPSSEIYDPTLLSQLEQKVERVPELHYDFFISTKDHSPKHAERVQWRRDAQHVFDSMNKELISVQGQEVAMVEQEGGDGPLIMTNKPLTPLRDGMTVVCSGEVVGDWRVTQLHAVHESHVHSLWVNDGCEQRTFVWVPKNDYRLPISRWNRFRRRISAHFRAALTFKRENKSTACLPRY